MRTHTILEVVIGVLYAMGATHQALWTLQHSEDFYVDMADQAWLGPAQTFVEEVLVPHSVVVTVLVVILQATIAIAILSRGRWVVPALVAGGVFSIVGALTGSPAEFVGYGILACIHFWLASTHRAAGLEPTSGIDVDSAIS